MESPEVEQCRIPLHIILATDHLVCCAVNFGDEDIVNSRILGQLKINSLVSIVKIYKRHEYIII